LGGQPVDVRRSDFLLAVTSQIAVTEVVGENENDVRFALRFGAETVEVGRLRVPRERTGEHRQTKCKTTNGCHLPWRLPETSTSRPIKCDWRVEHRPEWN